MASSAVGSYSHSHNNLLTGEVTSCEVNPSYCYLSLQDRIKEPVLEAIAAPFLEWSCITVDLNERGHLMDDTSRQYFVDRRDLLLKTLNQLKIPLEETDSAKNWKIYRVQKQLINLVGGPQEFDKIPTYETESKIADIDEIASDLLYSSWDASMYKTVDNLAILFKLQLNDELKIAYLYVDDEGCCKTNCQDILNLKNSESCFEYPEDIEKLKEILQVGAGLTV